MTRGTTSIDGTPISASDLARLAAEERLHADQQRNAVRVVAGSARDAADCRQLLSILGLGHDVVRSARGERRAAAKRPRKRRAA